MIDERLRHVTLKVERAKKHVAHLDSEIAAFLKTNPYTVATKHDPQTRKLIYYVGSVQSTPDCLPLLAGDAIQNLMSALDHLAYQLVGSDTNDALRTLRGSTSRSGIPSRTTKTVRKESKEGCKERCATRFLPSTR